MSIGKLEIRPNIQSFVWLILIDETNETIEEGILEAKTECYAKDKVKSHFRSFYDDF